MPVVTPTERPGGAVSSCRAVECGMEVPFLIAALSGIVEWVGSAWLEEVPIVVVVWVSVGDVVDGTARFNETEGTKSTIEGS